MANMVNIIGTNKDKTITIFGQIKRDKTVFIILHTSLTQRKNTFGSKPKRGLQTHSQHAEFDKKRKIIRLCV